MPKKLTLKKKSDKKKKLILKKKSQKRKKRMKTKNIV
jgi:hypothetical protein